MKTVILCGLRLADEYRISNWSYCRNRWEEETQWPIFEGHHDDGEFCLSVASNRAAEAAGDWEMAVYVGADFILGDYMQAWAAVSLAKQTGQLTFAHDRLTMLQRDERKWLMTTGEIKARGDKLPNTFSGILAIPRVLWDRVGGFDERFVGWGFEDQAFWASCWAMGGGFQRVPGEMFHLWHPPAETHPHIPASHALWERYMAAKTNRIAMREILAERELVGG